MHLYILEVERLCEYVCFLISCIHTNLFTFFTKKYPCSKHDVYLAVSVCGNNLNPLPAEHMRFFE